MKKSTVRRSISVSRKSKSLIICRLRHADAATAFVSIMECLRKYCSYCVVPYTRGEEFSRPVEDVLVEIAQLAAQGVKEVTLLGQNVNAYRGEGPDGRNR